jgi:transposase
MKYYIGLDVSLKETQVCVVDESGGIIGRHREVTHPALLAALISKVSVAVETVVLETGGQSSWLQRELLALGVPAVIVDARQAKAALSCRMNKTDVNDAEGLAQLARTGWYREVLAKRPAAQRARAVLVGRQLLVKQRRDLENQIRGVLRGFGLAVGTVARTRFEERVRDLLRQEVSLAAVLDALLLVRQSLNKAIKDLEGRIRGLAEGCPDCSRLMTVPGVGPMTALAFVTAIDEPGRFRRSSSVGAYLGLTPRRYQSGEVNWSGRISKQGDSLARHMLYEAANSLISRVRKWSAPKAWATRLVRKVGSKKARVALARKLAVIMHRMWRDGSDFRWSNEATA